jgi:hypothetical protein
MVCESQVWNGVRTDLYPCCKNSGGAHLPLMASWTRSIPDSLLAAPASNSTPQQLDCLARFRKSQYPRVQHKANLPAATKAFKSPSLTFFGVLLAHNVGRNFALRRRGIVQKFAHSWQAIAFGGRCDFPYWN